MKMPEVGAKMPSQITNNNVVYSKCFVRSQTKKKVIAHGDCQEFFFYRRTLKQMKQKRSSCNLVHLFLQLLVLLHQVLKKQRHMLRSLDEEKMVLRLMLQPNKNTVISKIKKCCSQLPKSSEKMP